MDICVPGTRSHWQKGLGGLSIGKKGGLTVESLYRA